MQFLAIYYVCHHAMLDIPTYDQQLTIKKQEQPWLEISARDTQCGLFYPCLNFVQT